MLVTSSWSVTLSGACKYVRQIGKNGQSSNFFVQVKMARKWREREGTMEPGQYTKTQEDIVEELRALVKHPAVPVPATKVASGSAVVHAVCA